MNNLILTGFSGTGKSTVAQKIATLLAREFIDTDDLISHKAGMEINQIFEEDGEKFFRKLESQVIQEVCALDELVIAIGGGAFSNVKNRDLLLSSGIVISLDAKPKTIENRLASQSKLSRSSKDSRPLLQHSNSLERIVSLKAQREPDYQLSDSTVVTDELTVNQVAAKSIELWDKLRGETRTSISASQPDKFESDLSSIVHTDSGPYPVYVGWEILETLGNRCLSLGFDKRAFLFSDETVFDHYGEIARVSLKEAGLDTECFTVPSGEQSKSFLMATKCYEWLASQRAERGDLIVALGGGVIGDLAGFVASTFNRGLPFVQVPTSLAAMVDASIGGKTAVNLVQGKNLVGTFYQPKCVFADVKMLLTLPKRELASGWAEAIKHGLILDPKLLNDFETQSQKIITLQGDASVTIIKRSMAIKAAVVSQDEKETLGIRTMLNYGHTVAHGLEAATQYGKLLHGEAVSIGMGVAARISEKLGLISKELVIRQEELLRLYGLPTKYHLPDYSQVRNAMTVDKKSSSGKITWVLLEGVGKATLRSDVPEDTLIDCLNEVFL
jgi:shikimate kinase/3-dehydroquinate synthase